MRRAAGRTSLVGAALIVASAASTAHAAPSDGDSRRKEALALFDQAVKQAQEGDDRGALISFRAAYAKYPSFRVLYNVAQLCSRLGDGACAARAYETYLRDGGADVPAQRRAAVESEVRALAKLVATIRVTSSTAGAEIAIDEQPMGRTPLAEAISVNAGLHKVVLVQQEKTVEKGVRVVAGEALLVDLEFPSEAPRARAVVVAPEEPAAKVPPRERRAFPIVLWAVTGALAIGTVVTGVLASSAYRDFKNQRDSFPVSRESLDDAQGKARSLFIVAGAFGAVTVLAAGFSGYLTFVASGSSGQGIAVGPSGAYLVGRLP